MLNVRDEMLQQMTSDEVVAAITLAHPQRVQLVYDHLSLQGALVSWWPMVWHRFNIPRVSFLMWLVCMGRLQTCDRVKRYKPGIVSTCSLCGLCEETADHLSFGVLFRELCWSRL